jgi:hypothetical protein
MVPDVIQKVKKGKKIPRILSKWDGARSGQSGPILFIFPFIPSKLADFKAPLVGFLKIAKTHSNWLTKSLGNTNS